MTRNPIKNIVLSRGALIAPIEYAIVRSFKTLLIALNIMPAQAPMRILVITHSTNVLNGAT